MTQSLRHNRWTLDLRGSYDTAARFEGWTQVEGKIVKPAAPNITPTEQDYHVRRSRDYS